MILQFNFFIRYWYKENMIHIIGIDDYINTYYKQQKYIKCILKVLFLSYDVFKICHK